MHNLQTQLGHTVCLKPAEFYRFWLGFVHIQSNWWLGLVYVLGHRVISLTGQAKPGLITLPAVDTFDMPIYLCQLEMTHLTQSI